MQTVEIMTTPPSRLSHLLRPDRAELFLSLAARANEVLADRVVWNISSTAGGGGVAEMLHGFLRYVRGGGVEIRWVVIDGSPDFFTVTKRIHNQIHGEPGDGRGFDNAERAIYEGVQKANADALLTMIGPRDVLILHDPQTAGLAPRLGKSGRTVIWRCHVGTEHTNAWTEQAWAFLRPYVESADAAVFSRAAYVPGWESGKPVAIIAPSIDPLSAKNQPLSDETVRAILGEADILDTSGGSPTFLNGNDLPHPVTRRATVLRQGGPLPAAVPTVVQVSRWDRLKDMAGVLQGFVLGNVAAETGAHLLLVGPDPEGVTDDPEARAVLAECAEIWRGLTDVHRSGASLVGVPMDDLEENAAIINSLQRHATVIVQKSLKEGFGLTVSEGMWKGDPVVASAVGGIQDQVRDGVDGFLLPDPTDLQSFAARVKQLLSEPDLPARMGASGHERVRDHFLPDRDLGEWLALIERLAQG
jgi:trehalose synthase